jgi:hypothetical protein
MGYIAVIVAAIVVVPLLLLLMGGRQTRVGSRRDHGVTPSEPAADAPTPRADAVNQVAPGVERRLPPG